MASVRITDHEILAKVTADEDTVDEGSEAVFTVSLTVDDTAAGARNRSGVVVHYAIVGTVTAQQDYREASTGTLTFLAGDDVDKITITTIAGDAFDPGETLTVRLTGDTSVLGEEGLAVVHPTEGEASTNVVDEGSVTWSVVGDTVEEGDAVIFTVTLSALVQNDVTLTYRTADGSATAGSDYTAVSNGRLTVTGGNSRATFMVATLDDRVAESTETFTVRLELSNAPAGVEPLERTYGARPALRTTTSRCCPCPT